MKILFLMKEYRIALQIDFSDNYSYLKSEINLMIHDFYNEFIINKLTCNPAIYIMDRLSETYNIWTSWEIIPIIY